MASGASAAQASCAVPPSVPTQIRAAALVFVGSVVSTSDDNRIANVKVESVWKDPRLAGYVTVFGSSVSGANTATSEDRHYQAGTRYLFVLYSANEPYQDDACSATQPYTPALALLAPADARPPLTVGYPTDPAPNRYAGALFIVGALFVAGVTALAIAVLLARATRG